ncbi:hypothetical protein M3Y97_00501200 [Aphelenchoides bicaudatus]|nr:hypothetical protein M3Y97_00501200 [Aphelenchoides bicaudatus]
MATTATNSSQASPSPFPAALLGGFPPRNFQTTNGTSASPSSTPISSTSTSSSTLGNVFPNQNQNQQMPAGLFNPNYYAAFMQSQVMQQLVKQYMAGMTSGEVNGHTSADSRSPSTTTASPFGQSQQQKKILLDPDGNILCPVCENKVEPSLWNEHLNLERANLSKSIENLKENKFPNKLVKSEFNIEQPVPEIRRKREFELSRIRTNQQKRLSMKSTLLSGTSLRDTFMPQNSTNRSSQSSGKFLIGSLCETPPLLSTNGKNGDADVDRNFCKSCKRTQEYLIISNGLDEPRCMDCYRKYRRQVGALPLTITESPTDETSHSNGHRHGSHTTSSASPTQRDASGSTSGTPHDDEDLFGHQNGDDVEEEETPLKRLRMDIPLVE